MSLENFFQPQNLIFDLNSQSKEEAIRTLVDLLNRNYHVTLTPEKWVEEFMKREKKGSTGLQNGIAVPHIKIDTLSEFYLAVGIHRKGMDFKSIDGKPTHIIFLLAAPLSEAQTHLRFLSTMSRLFLQKDFKERVLKEKSSENVCKFFKEILL